jgi:hypothetical protein
VRESCIETTKRGLYVVCSNKACYGYRRRELLKELDKQEDSYEAGRSRKNHGTLAFLHMPCDRRRKGYLVRRLGHGMSVCLFNLLLKVNSQATAAAAAATTPSFKAGSYISETDVRFKQRRHMQLGAKLDANRPSQSKS